MSNLISVSNRVHRGPMGFHHHDWDGAEQTEVKPRVEWQPKQRWSNWFHVNWEQELPMYDLKCEYYTSFTQKHALKWSCHFTFLPYCTMWHKSLHNFKFWECMLTIGLYSLQWCHWASWHLKSPTNWLFVQQFLQANTKETIKLYTIALFGRIYWSSLHNINGQEPVK